MAPSKKKTVPQKVVHVATTGMPSPVRKFLGSRFIALLIALCIPVLFATGILSVRWENGRPRFSINRQKAAEVKNEAAEKIQDIRDQRDADRPDLSNIVPQFAHQPDSHSGFAADWRSDDAGLGERVGERVEELKDQFGEDRGSAWSFAPATGDTKSPERQSSGPLSRLKQRFESRR